MAGVIRMHDSTGRVQVIMGISPAEYDFIKVCNSTPIISPKWALATEMLILLGAGTELCEKHPQ